MSDMLIVVPARGGSKRLPGKNLRSLAGKPLLDYTAEAIVDAGLDHVLCLLSTDDQAIADHGKALGWSVPWLRPSHISGDDAPTVDAVVHALDWVRDMRGTDPDPVMVLQPTSPLRGADCLVRALSLLRDNQEAQAVVGMREHESERVSGPTTHLYATTDDGFIVADPDAGRLQPNGAVYAVRSAALRHHNSLYPPNTLPLRMDDSASVDIDTECDWQHAETGAVAARQRNYVAVNQS